MLCIVLCLCLYLCLHEIKRQTVWLTFNRCYACLCVNCTDVLLSRLSISLASLHWLHVSEQIKYKTSMLTFRVLRGSAPPYLGPLVPVHSLPGRRSLRSTGTSRLLVPSVKRSTVGSRALPVTGPKTWNTLPKDVTSSQSAYTFHRQLKTWRLFKKSFPDIIIWYWLHLDF